MVQKSVGDGVTIKGKVKSIGEVLGYSIDIKEIYSRLLKEPLVGSFLLCCAVDERRGMEYNERIRRCERCFGKRKKNRFRLREC